MNATMKMSRGGFRSTIKAVLGVLLLFAGVLALGGCEKLGGSHWSPAPAPAAAAVGPRVTAVTPANGATGVPINSRVTATFNKAMTDASISTTTFQLTGAGGAAIAGVVNYVAASRTATFTPDTNFSANTLITATVTTGVTDTAGTPMANNFVWSFRTGATLDSTVPMIIATVNDDGETGVPVNRSDGATFSEPMDPSTINTTTFTISRAADTIPGVVTYSGVDAVFNPTGDLLPNTVYVSRITTGARDLSGNPLAADSVWTWTTGADADTIAPTVTLVNPANGAGAVCVNKSLGATFSEPMDPLTISNLSFTLRATASGVDVPGTVTYDSNIATFNPTATLTANTQYTATIDTSVQDLAGNEMAAPFAWSFTTGTGTCATGVALGTAAPFGGMGGAAGLTNEGLLTVVNGDLATTGASTLVTGFRDSVGDIYTVTPLNDGIVNGRIYTAAPPPGGAGVGGNATTLAIATQALDDANTAYNNLLPAAKPGGTDPGAGQLGGLVLTPGIYQAAGGSFMITGNDLTLDAQGDPNGVFIFQMASTLTVGEAAVPRSVILVGGAQAKNIYWQVGTSATINQSGGGTMVGTIISSAATSISTSGNVNIVTLNGRALALNASTTMTNTVINVPGF